MDKLPPTKRVRETEESVPSRPRRAKVPILKKSHSLHDLVPLIAASSSMPSVIIDSEAMLIMSLHSHLCSDEVIGWMGGIVSDNCIEIKGAFPVQALAHENGRINVEMDVEHALTVRSEIETLGFNILGWYHSHPTFEVLPSVMDIDNQISYQDISTQCFLGGIISPYFSTHKLEGVVTIFQVKKNNEEYRRNGYHPAYSVKFNIKYGEVNEESIKKAVKLVEEYKTHNKFVQPAKKWKKGLSVGQKIQKALENIGLSPSQISEINSVLLI
jgi:proteasome lid subunit RPN8/RPN11